MVLENFFFNIEDLIVFIEYRYDEIVIIINNEIYFENVEFGYILIVFILKNILFFINCGEIIGFIGFFGEGKIILIRFLLCLIYLNSGNIYIDG